MVIVVVVVVVVVVVDERHNSEFLTLGDDQFDVVRSDIL